MRLATSSLCQWGGGGGGLVERTGEIDFLGHLLEEHGSADGDVPRAGEADEAQQRRLLLLFADEIDLLQATLDAAEVAQLDLQTK